MDFISIRKLKFYTKETLKLFNITLIAFGFIISIVLIKYKPMYEVKISGQKVGYVKNKSALTQQIVDNIENYQGKNIDRVNLTKTPDYELKLVEKTKDDNDSEIIIALQKELEITYKYYEIASDNETIEKVDSQENANQVIDELKKVADKDLTLTVSKKTTKEIDELNINSVDVAKQNIITKLDIDTTVPISRVNGVKIATLPISGTITSRYGVSSTIRSSTHTGLDIAAAKGTPIKVIANGVVTFADKKGAYGYLVKVDHGNGVETWYAHTSKMYVTAGQSVKAGDVIADVGSTGNSTGPHLHLEVRVDGQHLNPQDYLYN